MRSQGKNNKLLAIRYWNEKWNHPQDRQGTPTGQAEG